MVFRPAATPEITGAFGAITGVVAVLTDDGSPLPNAVTARMRTE